MVNLVVQIPVYVWPFSYHGWSEHHKTNTLSLIFALYFVQVRLKC